MFPFFWTVESLAISLAVVLTLFFSSEKAGRITATILAAFNMAAVMLSLVTLFYRKWVSRRELTDSARQKPIAAVVHALDHFYSIMISYALVLLTLWAYDEVHFEGTGSHHKSTFGAWLGSLVTSAHLFNGVAFSRATCDSWVGVLLLNAYTYTSEIIRVCIVLLLLTEGMSIIINKAVRRSHTRKNPKKRSHVVPAISTITSGLISIVTVVVAVFDTSLAARIISIVAAGVILLYNAFAFWSVFSEKWNGHGSIRSGLYEIIRYIDLYTSFVLCWAAVLIVPWIWDSTPDKSRFYLLTQDDATTDALAAWQVFLGMAIQTFTSIGAAPYAESVSATSDAITLAMVLSSDTIKLVLMSVIITEAVEIIQQQQAYTDSTQPDMTPALAESDQL